MQFARKPLLIEAVSVEWENLDEIVLILTVPDDTPDYLTPTIAYVNPAGEDEDGKTRPPSITLHDDKINGPEFDTTKEIGLLVPRGDGNFLLVNRGDWIAKGQDDSIFPLKGDELFDDFEVLP